MSGTTQNSEQSASAARTAEAAVQDWGKVESKTPGRMRVRLKPELRTPEAMARIQESLNSHPDVSQAAVNQRTGSVVITHDKQQDSHSVFAAALKETEFVVAAVLELPDAEEEEGGGGDRFAKLDQQLADAMYKVEYAVYKKTGLRFRGQVVAGTIAGAGIAQIAVYGISLEMLPGPLLLWIAWDIYHRVAKEPPFPEVAAAADADATAEASSATAQEAGQGLPSAALSAA